MSKFKVGFEILKEVYNLSILSIKHNCLLIPQGLEKQNHRVTGVFFENPAKKYVKKYETNENIPKIEQNQDMFTQKNNYSSFLISSGISFKTLFSKCFKLNEYDFELQISKNNEIKIEILNHNDDDFLQKNKALIEKKLEKMNKKFEKDSVLAKKDRKLLQEESKQNLLENAHKSSIANKKVQKENFII